MSFIKYISNEQHYNEVLSLASKCKESLCIETADIKDLHVKVGDTQEPFLMIVAESLKRGVDVMLIHAKEPGPNFREDFDRFPILYYDGAERSSVLLAYSFPGLIDGHLHIFSCHKSLLSRGNVRPRTGKDKRFRAKARILSREKPGEEGFPAGQAK